MSTVISAAIFDLDGVLLDTEPLYTQAAQSTLARYGKQYESHHKRFIMGRTPLEGASWLVRELALPLSAEQYLEERRDCLERLFIHCPSVDGASELVREARLRGLRLALATSSERRLYQLKVRAHSWFDAFEAVICGDDSRLVQSKPSPDIYLLASSAIDVAPKHCVVFEDSPAGVQAALAAGMRVVARLQPPVLKSDLAGAHVVVSSYAELDLNEVFWR
jgi:pseudouridine 5'-phosphatase